MARLYSIRSYQDTAPSLCHLSSVSCPAAANRLMKHPKALQRFFEYGTAFPKIYMMRAKNQPMRGIDG